MIALPKRLLLILAFCVGLNSIATAQDFFKDYKTYLASINHLTKKREALIDTSIKRQRMAVAAYEKENKQPFFATDTIYQVSFYTVETGATAELIWTKSGSCYYSDSPVDNVVNRKLVIKASGAEILSSFATKFRSAIETGDTAAYHIYADKNKVYDGEHVSPLMAIKSGRHWKFLPFQNNGWAISYDLDLEAEKAKEKAYIPVTLSSMVENAIRKSLHFNIDSAKASSKNNPADPPAFPIIVLNDKIVDFSFLNRVQANEVIAITVLSGTNPKAAIYGLNSKYGVIVIKTNGRKQY